MALISYYALWKCYFFLAGVIRNGVTFWKMICVKQQIQSVKPCKLLLQHLLKCSWVLQALHPWWSWSTLQDIREGITTFTWASWSIVSLLNTLWWIPFPFFTFPSFQQGLTASLNFLMTGTVSGTIGIKNGKIGVHVYRVYPLYHLWLNSASLGIFKPGPGKQGLFKHIWWKEPYLCSTQGMKKMETKRRSRPSPSLYSIKPGAWWKRMGGECGWSSHSELPPVQMVYSGGPIASCYSSHSARHRCMMWPAVDPIAITFIYY